MSETSIVKGKIIKLVQSITQLKPDEQFEMATYFHNQLDTALHSNGLILTDLKDIATHFGVDLQKAAIIRSCGHKESEQVMVKDEGPARICVHCGVTLPQ